MVTYDTKGAQLYPTQEAFENFTADRTNYYYGYGVRLQPTTMQTDLWITRVEKSKGNFVFTYPYYNGANLLIRVPVEGGYTVFEWLRPSDSTIASSTDLHLSNSPDYVPSYGEYVFAAETPPPPDRDGDGIPDSEDIYPDDPTNTPPPDRDSDGIPDSEDIYPDDPTNTPPPDRDSDGIPDSEDIYPDDPTNTPPDRDGDGIPDSEDPLPNRNLNGIPLPMLKLYLGIQPNDTVQDALLLEIIKDSTSIVLDYIEEDILPSGLQWVVREMAISRYNRIGSEGLQSMSEEGRSENYGQVAFDLLPHQSYLDSYLIRIGKTQGNGKAKFL